MSYAACLAAANAISYLIGLVCPILEYQDGVVVTVHEHFNSDGESVEGGEGVSVMVLVFEN